MLNGTTERLEEAIVDVFSRSPQMTAGELSSALARRGRRYTIQAIYQELRKLQSEGVVTKARNRYMLRVAWVLGMVELTDRLYESYTVRSSLLGLLPREGEKVSWRIPSVSRLVTFWAQINLAMLTASGEKQLFEFLPHVWFHLAAGPDEEQFMKGLRLTRIRYFCAVGGNEFLDRSYARVASAIGAEVRFGLCPFRRPVETYHGVAGDFLITTKLSRKIAAEIEKIYSQVTRSEDYLMGALTELFNRKEPATLVVECGTPKASRYRKDFRNFFGVGAGR